VTCFFAIGRNIRRGERNRPRWIGAPDRLFSAVRANDGRLPPKPRIARPGRA